VVRSKVFIRGGSDGNHTCYNYQQVEQKKKESAREAAGVVATWETKRKTLFCGCCAGQGIPSFFLCTLHYNRRR
jgi:hypothetical protein